MDLHPWSGSVHRLVALNLRIQECEKVLEQLYIERDRLSWEMEEGDHSE